MTKAAAQLAALEALLLDEHGLVEFEAMLGQFNVFEAIGVANQELRHSDFLAFLLDPDGKHGLGDRFTRAFLRRALQGLCQEPGPLRPADLALLDLSEAAVDREWRNIDILLVDRPNQLVVVIENKTGTGEHSDQLARYAELARRSFAAYRLVCIFLTPDGAAPSHPAYHAVGYRDVVELVDEAADMAEQADVAVGLRHYAALVRKNVIMDPEVSNLCRRIYTRHQDAMESMRSWLKEAPAEAERQFEAWMHHDRDLLLDTSGDLFLRFAPKAWESWPAQRAGDGTWTSSKRLLLFEFYIDDDSVSLILGPGKADVRQALYDAAADAVARLGDPDPLSSYTCLFYLPLLTDHEKQLPFREHEAALKEAWARFVEEELPGLTEILERAAGSRR